MNASARRAAIEQREYDPRREERRKATRVALPDDVEPRMLDDDSRRELRSLSKETSELVARHLVMTGRLVDDDPEQALAHARAARALAGRIGVVRQAVGLTAYAAGEWNEALSELRAARRITGRPEHLAVFADCERGLGRPERALAYGDDPQVPALSQDERVELVIVLAGARRDLGQADAAVLMLQDPAKRTTQARPWAVRLWYAYADALLDAGRIEQAREWFERTADADADGQTDAGDRLLVLDGVTLDLNDDDDDNNEEEDEATVILDETALQALVAEVFGDPTPDPGGEASNQVAPAPQVEAVSGESTASGTAAEAPVTRPEPEPVSKSAIASIAHHPFSESEPRVPPSAARPPAALTPTFAAPDAPAVAQDAKVDDDKTELTLFE